MIDPIQHLSRRAFLRNGTLCLFAANFIQPKSLFADERTPVVRAGLITDLHYADKPPAGTRHYRETLNKLGEAGSQFEKEKPDFIVELGDLIDAADSVETEKKWLERIHKDFSELSTNRHCVLGNHCVDTLTKEEFLGGVGQEKSYYSFEVNGVHFVVLDACFRSDGKPYGRKNSKWDDANIPEVEVQWLKADLKSAKGPVIVFAHQRLDGTNAHCVKNAESVRKVFEDSTKVNAVFQGHSHQNDVKDIGGIHYCTLAAMVEGSGAESNGYSLLDVHADGSIELHGFRRQVNHNWKA